MRCLSGRCMCKEFCLFSYRLNDFRMAMPRYTNAKACCEVNVEVVINVNDVCSACLLPRCGYLTHSNRGEVSHTRPIRPRFSWSLVPEDQLEREVGVFLADHRFARRICSSLCHWSTKTFGLLLMS